MRANSCIIAAFCAIILMAAACSAAAEKAAQDDPLLFKQDAWPLLQVHCVRCHGAKKQKMGVDFSTMTGLLSILGHRDVWRRAREALESGDMPPDPEETSFTDADRKRLMDWVRDRVETIDRRSPIYLDPGPPVLRQLTRVEYNNTIVDLLRLDRFDAASAGGIVDPSNFVSEHFANLAAAQSLDQTLVEKYLAAGDAALDVLFNRNAKARSALLSAHPDNQTSPHDAARVVLTRFLRRAHRQQVDGDELDELLGIFDDATRAGDGFEPAIRKAMRPVLVSAAFLYRIEEDRPDAGSDAYKVNDDELAVRLSYFLWSSMPDDELFALADAGRLSQPDVLDAQIKRILADPRARALTDNFAASWLRLAMMNRALPSQDVFPALTRSLKDAMRQEPALFFDNLRAEDRSILDLLDADYTFANEELARFYGIPGVSGPKMQKVALSPQFHRGGLLGMGCILAMTSHTDRTKPTARGKWILDVLLGTPPPPPPANAGNFAAPNNHAAPPKNFREKLALHASDASCAACHKRIDPLGFALENYDGAGAWRDSDAGKPVDNVGRLPRGKEFQGVEGLKQVLHERQEQFIRNVVTQMMTYALGRQLQYTDDLAVADIVDALKRDDYRFSTLIRGVVMSRPFLYRRNG